jgi:hypothetical protein
MGGTRSKVEGGDRHDLEPEGTHEDLFRVVLRPALGVVPRRDCGCSARYPTLLYIVQGAGS